MEILRCPACLERPPVHEDGEALVCDVCGRRYPIEEGIPRMIVDEPEETEPGRENPSAA
jgi:uncharacterized protein YbaR (Trm112 family)